MWNYYDNSLYKWRALYILELARRRMSFEGQAVSCFINSLFYLIYADGLSMTIRHKTWCVALNCFHQLHQIWCITLLLACINSWSLGTPDDLKTWFTATRLFIQASPLIFHVQICPFSRKKFSWHRKGAASSFAVESGRGCRYSRSLRLYLPVSEFLVQDIKDANISFFLTIT